MIQENYKIYNKQTLEYNKYISIYNKYILIYITI